MLGLILGLGLGSGAAGAPVPQIPPANLSAPVINDTSPEEGQLLDTTLGAWDNRPSAYSIQWQRKANGAPDGSAIAIEGADDLTYILPLGAYVGDLLRVAVTATNEAGSAIAYSAWTLPVAAAPTVPGQVTGVDVVALSPTSIHIMFTPVAGATSYEYQLNGGSWIALAENGAVEGLTQNTLYSVAVRALNSVGAGAASAVDTITTPAIFDGQPLFYNSGEGRQRGLGYTPTWAEPAFSQTFPGDAVYLSAQANYAAAHAAARLTTSKTLVIDQDVAIIGSDLGKANVALLGKLVAGVKPKMTLTGVTFASNTKCLLYGVDDNITVRGIEFVSFADVFGIAIPSINTPAYPAHDSSQYGFARRCPSGTTVGSVSGVALAYAGAVANAIGAELSTTFDICDCVFTNCQSVATMMSDAGHLRPVKYQRNKSTGTFGGVGQSCIILSDAYVYGNEWTGCSGSREITTLKSNHHHTWWFMGSNNGSSLKTTRTHTILIENNWLHDIYDSAFLSDVNAAVGIDIRNGNPTMTGWDYAADRGYAVRYTASSSISIAYNDFENLIGLQGQEDCNAIYLKTLGVVIEHNRIKNCGAKDLRFVNPGSTRDGSECTSVLLKNPGDWLSTAAEMRLYANIIRFNDIIDPPSHDEGQDPALFNLGLFVIKVDGNTGNGGCATTYMIGNHISNWRYQLNGGSGSHPSALRSSNYFPNGLYIEDNDLFDCPISGAGRIVILNSANSATVGAIKDNRAFDGLEETYTANRNLIDKRGSSCSVSGNRLIAAAQPDATATFSAETATASAGIPRLEPRALPETETSIRVQYDGMDALISNGAIA